MTGQEGTDSIAAILFILDQQKHHACIAMSCDFKSVLLFL